METVFDTIKSLFLGFFGLVGLLFVLTLIFGKRVIKQWEFEANFNDEKGREFGEFDIELSRLAKEESVDTLKASFRMRHPTLESGQRVQVFLEDQLVMEGSVSETGRIRLRNEHLVNEPKDPAVGQVCRVVYGGQERFRSPLVPDD